MTECWIVFDFDFRFCLV